MGTHRELSQDVSLYGMKALDNNNVWVVGDMGWILKYDGEVWIDMYFGIGDDLREIDMVDEDFLFLIGKGQAEYSGYNLFHHVNGEWLVLKKDIVNDILGMHVLDEKHVWLIDGAGILFYNGWFLSAQSNYIYCPHDIYAADSDNVWAVFEYSSFYYFDGESWTMLEKELFPSDTPRELISGAFNPPMYGISGMDAEHVWSVGQNGLIVFFDGSSWHYQTSGTLKTLYDVSVADENHAWAVGSQGTILFCDGNSWFEQDSGTQNDLMCVSAFNKDTVWAAGKNGTILRFNGEEWRTIDISDINNDL